MKTKNKGLAIHCHHDILVEYCYDYEERKKSIIKTKPANEQETRLRLFKILPKKAEKDIPVDLLQTYQVLKQANQAWKQAYQVWKQAYQAWEQAYQVWKQANQALKQTYQALKQAYQALKQADQALKQADQAWEQESKDAFHKKWCGCKEWNGKEIVFPIKI